MTLKLLTRAQLLCALDYSKIQISILRVKQIRSSFLSAPESSGWFCRAKFHVLLKKILILVVGKADDIHMTGMFT